MIFLYRLDMLPLHGLLADPYSTAAPYATGERTSLLLTNWEEPIVLAGASPLVAAFLPPDTSMGSSTTFLPAVGIEHSGLTLNSEKASGEMTLSLPLAHPVSQLWAQGSPQFQVWVTIAFLETVDSTAQVVWSGRVRGAEFGELMCSLSGMHLGDLVQRQGLVRKHSRSCPHTLFDPATCGVNPNAVHPTDVPFYYLHREDGFLGTVSADGLTIHVPQAVNRADGFFANDGMLIVAGNYTLWHVPRTYTPTANRTNYPLNIVRGGIARSIVGHVGDTLTLAVPLPASLAAGAQVTLYRGCKKTDTDCETSFSNFEKGYGGYPFIPIKNIFQTGLK